MSPCVLGYPWPSILVVVGSLEMTHPLFSVCCDSLRLSLGQSEWEEPKEVVLLSRSLSTGDSAPTAGGPFGNAVSCASVGSTRFLMERSR